MSRLSSVSLLLRQRRIQHANDAADLEADRIGIGILHPFGVGAFVIDRDDAEQLLLGRIGAQP